ncbi:MAG: QueT transporter family protein [Bacillota bacterium]|nr:QueT transporter family protein [Bacillota bacterium]
MRLERRREGGLRAAEGGGEPSGRTVARRLARVALVAAAYFALTVVLGPLGYGPVQLRVSEALTLLPVRMAEAPLGLWAGCMLANLAGGLGPWDIFGGSAVTLLAALLTRRLRGSWLAFLPPILLNGLLVPAYLSPLYHVPYLPTAAAITASEAVVVVLFGGALLIGLRRLPASLLEEGGQRAPVRGRQEEGRGR